MKTLITMTFALLLSSNAFAKILSPTASQLEGVSVKVSWEANSDSDTYWLWVYDDNIRTIDQRVSTPNKDINLPADGSIMRVVGWAVIQGRWVKDEFSFISSSEKTDGGSSDPLAGITSVSEVCRYDTDFNGWWTDESMSLCIAKCPEDMIAFAPHSEGWFDQDDYEINLGHSPDHFPTWEQLDGFQTQAHAKPMLIMLYDIINSRQADYDLNGEGSSVIMVVRLTVSCR